MRPFLSRGSESELQSMEFQDLTRVGLEFAFLGQAEIEGGYLHHRHLILLASSGN